jgi:putative ABC transport system permease protein
VRLLRFLYTAPLRLRSLLRREQVESDLDEEFQYHLERQIEANIAKGMPAHEARYAALRTMGGIEQQKEKCRDARRVSLIEDLVNDLRYGLRVLAKSPVFTTVAITTLALGIGANTAIFSVVNELLLRPLPFPDADRIATVWEVSPEGRHQNTISRANFRTWRDQNTSFESLAAFSDQRLNMTGDQEPEEISVQLATPELFEVLRVQPILGRTLVEGDGRERSAGVVLSYGIWHRKFAGDPNILGRPVILNDISFAVVGVMPAGFQWHIRARSGTGSPADMWIVLSMPTEGPATLGRFLSAVGRLKPGVSIGQAETELRAIEARIGQDCPQYNKGYSVEVIPLREQFVGNVRTALWILLGAVGFVLLIACANVANLLLARAAARQREIALRTALGASRFRVARQLLAESVLLALLGSVLGLGIAWWGIKALVAISPRDLINLQGVGLNIVVLGWTLVVSLVTGIVFGLAPALEATRMNFNDALKEGGKGAGGQGPRSSRLRNSLVIAEVALAVMLLVGAGLLVRSFVRLRNIDTGFEKEHVLTMVVRLAGARYQHDPPIVNFFEQAMQHIRSLPGVRLAGMVNFLPLYGGLGSSTGFTIEGRPQMLPGEGPSANVRVSDSGYFSAIGIPILRGRNFTEGENNTAKHVVIISQSLAEQYFPDEDPLGKHIDVTMFDKPNPTKIVGIVGDVRYDSLTNQPEPTVYFPHPELPYEFMTLVIRTYGDPAAITSAVREELREIDANQPVADVRTMQQVMGENLSRARFNTLLLALLAGLATILAAVGIFGVMNYSVTVRTRELGIRIALGAQRSKVLMLVLRQGLLLTLIGVGIGVLGTLAMTSVISGLLFGVAPTDPVTFAAIVLLLTGVSLIACYLPARRATRVDAVVALRYD